ncbi:hypothetical protein RJ640_015284 [Escallonia rubra]|uniref:Beta-glucosidase n=1 Tax=Escallonia rubra TaxID=112253 RepID=A0AA88U0T0_9ASTE|nr:hypothetical protein RJ640_015284 [Escallonia rubra]
MSKPETMGCIYKIPDEPIEARVQDLLSRMTLQEKLGQMTQIERSVAAPSAIKDLSIGSVLSCGGSGPFEKALSSDWADMVDTLQQSALQSRLGIPILYGIDAIHGNNNVYGATVFPHNVGLGATRDPELARRIGVATALEVRASGIHYNFAPCVAVCRDPRWGRCYESFSEDTDIVRKMASVLIGLQGQPPKGHPNGYPFVADRSNVVACAKHFVGDGGTVNGKNEGDTISSYDDLEKIHLAPYLDCISQGVCTVMASYSSWNGSKLHTNHFLLTQVLKEKLGFKGFVISDSEALDRFYHPHGSNYRNCVLSAINAGIDMVMVPFRYELYLEDLTYLVESGEIPMTRIDDAVERILRVKFVAGLFEYPLSDRSLLDSVGCKLHRELAREAVRKSLVLLKNGKDQTKPFLPCDKNAKRILVAGTHADNLGYQCGGWTATWEGKSGKITTGTTILDAIKEAVGDKTDVIYEQNPSPDTFNGEEFSFAIVAVGEPPYVETGGDNSELTIPFNGAELISSIASRVPTLVILVSGRPLVLEPWLLEKIDALFAAWLPGNLKAPDLKMSIAEGMICVYRNPDEPIEARIKDLISRMTIKEKIGQMTQIDRSVATPSALKDLSIGSVLSGGGSKPFEKATSSDWADMVDGFQKAALESRLGIPIFYGVDAVHGNNTVYGATVFPHNVGLGATRDADLAQRIGVATALEVRASGVQYAFAPCIAVCKDPRWGRCYESFSEDTETVRKMASILIGLQGQPPEGHPKGYPFVAGRNNVMACAKHFVGDGGTNKGENEGDTVLSFDDLERIHVAPYLDCISQGVCTIMASYSTWNGRRLHSDHFLLTEILKDRLGFKGMVISDWEALDRLVNIYGLNYRDYVLSTINAGIDMVMVPFNYELFLEDLMYLVESGEIPMARIDDAVERILRVKFAAGLFEYPLSDRSLLDIVGCKLHRELAREAVRKSLVLLKNGKDPKKPFLPLERNAKRILVAGTHADDLGYQCGGWTATWAGTSGRITIGTTILDAIKEAVGSETEVVHEPNPTPDTFAGGDFSFAIVAVGEPPYVESGGDNSELTIPFNGAEVVSLVADRIPTLMILISGRPLVLEPWFLEKLDALVAAWLPGSEGRGITDVIFGDYEFQGRLPMTWFKRVEQLPLHAEENLEDPLFPFGFGLTSNTKVLQN